MHADGGRPAGAVGGLTDDEPGRFPRSLRKRFEARNITEPQIPIKNLGCCSSLSKDNFVKTSSDTDGIIEASVPHLPPCVQRQYKMHILSCSYTIKILLAGFKFL